MKMFTLLAAIILAALTFGSCTKETTAEIDVISSDNVVALETELMQVVNDHRLDLGLNSLEFDSTTYQYANKHNEYMIAKGKLSHDNFSSRASKISKQTEAEYVAENVASGFNTAQGAFQEWLSSNSHKTTMEGNFTQTAISVKKAADGNLYFTQIFFR